MDRRIILALVLSALVFFLTPVLFPPAPPTVDAPPDTVVARPDPVPGPAPVPTPAERPELVPFPDTAPPLAPPAEFAIAPETTVVVTPRATYRFSSVGAMLIGADMLTYENLAYETRPVELAVPGAPLLSYGMVAAADTFDLRRTPFSLTRGVRGNAEVLEYRAQVGGGEVVISYMVPQDTAMSYRFAINGVATGITGARHLLVWLPATLQTAEADTVDDRRNLAYVLKTRREGARSVGFGSLDPGERRGVEGPHAWAAAKSKYFVIGVLTPPAGDQQFSEATLEGGPRVARAATHAIGVVAQPLREGTFRLDAYVGPQEWRRLLAVGQEFDQVNPYGWRFMQGIIQPFATIVMRVLLWMHNALALSYGWVLVIFGVAVRMLLWPLNQKAMRASLKMQVLQPKLAEVQKKYATNPEKQRAELMRIYKEAGASPFTAVSGCLPMLLPMPFLVALFFIFQSTIEFRGVPFLWLDDISIKDPYYILPIGMGASMFVVSWIGMRNAPANPQMKMMGYVFPVMITIFLLNFAAGLNLYYAVQNLATIPQQWLLARERARMMAKK
jgi:YidC/Oxa1 family membrane protein insertase